MTVETRYVVVREGEEVLSTTDKKQADEYDKMLDIADAMSLFLEQSKITMAERDREELSVYLAQHKTELLTILGAKKAKPKTSSSSAKKASLETVTTE